MSYVDDLYDASGAPHDIGRLVEALHAGGWTVRVSSSHGLQGMRGKAVWRHLRAVRGDYRMDVEWVRLYSDDAGQVTWLGGWRRPRLPQMTERHPDQDPDLFARRHLSLVKGRTEPIRSLASACWLATRDDEQIREVLP